MHLPRPFADILVDMSFVGGCVLVFLYDREEDQWAQWRADYSRAIDRLFFPPDLKQIPLQMEVGETVVLVGDVDGMPAGKEGEGG